MTSFNRGMVKWALALVAVGQGAKRRWCDGETHKQGAINEPHAWPVVLPYNRTPSLCGSAGLVLWGYVLMLIITLAPCSVWGLTVDLGQAGRIDWARAEAVVHGIGQTASKSPHEDALEAARFNFFCGLKTIAS